MTSLWAALLRYRHVTALSGACEQRALQAAHARPCERPSGVYNSGPAPLSATSLCAGLVAGPERANRSLSLTASCSAEAQLKVSEPARDRRRTLDLPSIPMLDTKVSCASPSAEPVAMPWRHVLERLAARPQAATLTDTFGRAHTYLRISLTERCNLRCRYCMPADGVDLTPAEQLMTSDEILRLARIFVHEGVTKVRLTGGEPTVRRDLVDVCARLAALPGLQTLAMTTNGLALRRSLHALRAAGLSALNISLDTLRPERFAEMTRHRGQERVLAAIHEAVALGFAVKVNVVVMRGDNEDELLDFVALTRDAPLNVRFIEYMPFDDNAWSRRKMFTYKEMVDAIEAGAGPLSRVRDPHGEVAKNFRLPGYRGSVAFITSMTEHFCAECNRVRLMADGNLKVCLFGANEVSLRDAMREGATDEQLRRLIQAAVLRKRFAHADADVLAATRNRAMIQIGG